MESRGGEELARGIASFGQEELFCTEQRMSEVPFLGADLSLLCSYTGANPEQLCTKGLAGLSTMQKNCRKGLNNVSGRPKVGTPRLSVCIFMN